MKKITPLVLVKPATQFAVDAYCTRNWTAPDGGQYEEYTAKFFDEDGALLEGRSVWLTYQEAQEFQKDRDVIHQMIAKKLGVEILGDAEDPK